MWCMAIQILAVRRTTAALGRAAAQLVAIRRTAVGQRPPSASQHSTASVSLSTLLVRRSVNRSPLSWKAIIALSMMGCAAEAPLQLAPIGPHHVEIGQTWALRISAQGGVAPYKWRVKAGPALAIAAAGSAECLLTWTPTLLDLAPTKPGLPRSLGAAQPLVVEVEDGAQGSAQSAGTLQAAPALRTP